MEIADILPVMKKSIKSRVLFALMTLYKRCPVEYAFIFAASNSIPLAVINLELQCSLQNMLLSIIVYVFQSYSYSSIQFGFNLFVRT